ncbi:uncharacterized protein [Drosophila suzukii]|uniref:Uncharacterized protein isoform X2 n=1 Tax=Drosophila suzukii TaxID=28584 RepID=A0AB40A890_DROSZ|nr:uncharacterized protein LOC108020352 isoform X2 [Drosophila suzukii]XP_016944026.1 uncharacterized protein LOC108020352 isoform X2 [Drosophila suzukii]XP_016944028.1 uncharacterized protein LOC108020352 isoform X2 [Drosophila suzukii]XP_036673366.1 uncharacterized protein LOC108020352 isoform X2 [Drosophila suzukii]XP_036673413.1 uncharacterized protein LOC108020352 isoform X2 [Drosophila suzukii]
MHCRRILIKYIQFDILVILATIRLGNANYLGARSRERNLNNNNGAKSEESAHIVNSGGVRTVGEVFVPKTFSLNSQEPTCEQLRAMWIFSKRQSRAAEITNEIPTYRDPFTYNVWEPLLLNSRMLGSLRMSARERARSPVFGRVVNREPNAPQRVPFEHHQRLVELGPGSSQTRYYGAESRPQNGASSSSRRSSKNRYMGVPNGTGNNAKESQNSVAIQGSFQKLKELIWTERAKELTEQRRDEELAARAAALKEIANGKNVLSNYNPQAASPSDSILMDENRSPDGNSYQYSDVNRMSILNEQNFRSDKSNKNRHRTGARATTRRIGNSASYNKKESLANKEHKTLFPGNNRAARIKIPSTELFSSDSTERDHSVIGIPRTYPIRKSHFRERNRSLLNEPQPNDHFHRILRGLTAWPFKKSSQEIDQSKFTSIGNTLGRQLDVLGHYSKQKDNNYFTSLENNDNLKMLNEQKPETDEFELGSYDYDYY